MQPARNYFDLYWGGRPEHQEVVIKITDANTGEEIDRKYVGYLNETHLCDLQEAVNILGDVFEEKGAK